MCTGLVSSSSTLVLTVGDVLMQVVSLDTMCGGQEGGVDGGVSVKSMIRGSCRLEMSALAMFD